MNDIKRLAKAIEELAEAIRTERATPQWIPYREPWPYQPHEPPYEPYRVTCTTSTGTPGIFPEGGVNSHTP